MAVEGTLARRALRPFAFVWSSWRAVSLQQVRQALALAVLLGTVQGAGNVVYSWPLVAWWRAFLSDFYDNVLIALALLLSLAVASRVRVRTVPRWLPFMVAAITPLLLSVAQFELPVWLVRLTGGDPSQWPGLTLPRAVGLWTHELPAAVLSATLALGYMFALEARQRADALRAAQLEHATLARRSYESRLKTLQARIDPQYLFDTLRHTEALYESDPVLAERLLDDLIAYLRAALPGAQDARSSLRAEISLGRAWLDIAAIRTGGRVSYTIQDPPDDAGGLPFPPMVLAPLLAAIVDAAAEASPRSTQVGLVADASADRVRLTLTTPALPATLLEAQRGVADVRERLARLCGDGASLAIGVSHRGTEVVVDVPRSGVPATSAEPSGEDSPAGTSRPPRDLAVA